MSLPIIVVGAGGRMGRAICSIVQENPDMTLAGVVERKEFQPVVPAGVVVTDDLAAAIAACPGACVIDFSAPSNSVHSAEVAAATGTPLVIGTTGFDAAQKEAVAGYAAKAPILWSPNMSVGVTVLKKFVPLLTKALGEDYDVDIVELHHNRKKDAPSGTALHLAEGVAEGRGWNLDEVRCSSRDGIIGPRPKMQIGIQAVRGGDIVGVHTVYFMTQGESIELTHRAQSRENFARGAVRAAGWLAGQAAGKLYTLADMI